MTSASQQPGLLNEGQPDPLLPEGHYRMKFVEYFTRQTMYGPKIYLRLCVIWPEAFAGVTLVRYYNAKRLTSREGLGGGFTLSPKGDGYRELTRLLETRLRPDRIPMTHLHQIDFIAAVRTVSRDGKGYELHEYARYSKIERLYRTNNDLNPALDTSPKLQPSPSLSPNPSPTPNPEPKLKPHPTFSEESWAAVLE